MEHSERVINVVFVFCEEKQRERWLDTGNKTCYHSWDKRGRTWGTCFQVHACCFWWYRWQRVLCVTYCVFQAEVYCMWVSVCGCVCVDVSFWQLPKHVWKCVFNCMWVTVELNITVILQQVLSICVTVINIKRKTIENPFFCREELS